MAILINLPAIDGQRELMEFDESLTLELFQEYSSGCYIKLSRSHYYLRDRPDVVEYIGKLVSDPYWKEVLVYWDW